MLSTVPGPTKGSGNISCTNEPVKLEIPSDPSRLCESQAPSLSGSVTCLGDGLTVTSMPPSSSEIPQLSDGHRELPSLTLFSYFCLHHPSPTDFFRKRGGSVLGDSSFLSEHLGTFPVLIIALETSKVSKLLILESPVPDGTRSGSLIVFPPLLPPFFFSFFFFWNCYEVSGQSLNQQFFHSIIKLYF